MLAVNTIDIVDYASAVFKITQAFKAFADNIGIEAVSVIPVSALKGHNIFTPSQAMDWLETVEVDDTLMQTAPMRFPVQCVNRPDAQFRGYAGTLKPGCVICVLLGGQSSQIQLIVPLDGEFDNARASQATTVTLHDKLDICRGNLLALTTAPPQCVDQFQARLAAVADIKYELNIHSLEHLAADRLGLKNTGICALSLDLDIAFGSCQGNSETDSFFLIDRAKHPTVAAGMIGFELRRASNIDRQATSIA